MITILLVIILGGVAFKLERHFLPESAQDGADWMVIIMTVLFCCLMAIVNLKIIESKEFTTSQRYNIVMQESGAYELTQKHAGATAREVVTVALMDDSGEAKLYNFESNEVVLRYTEEEPYALLYTRNNGFIFGFVDASKKIEIYINKK